MSKKNQIVELERLTGVCESFEQIDSAIELYVRILKLEGWERDAIIEILMEVRGVYDGTPDFQKAFDVKIDDLYDDDELEEAA